MYKVSVSYLNQQPQLYKKSANTSALASGNISIQCHCSLFKSVALAIQKFGPYVGISISIGLREYQCTRFLLVIYISGLSYTKKSANTSASASRNISIQCHRSLSKSVALAIQKVGPYVGIGIGIGLREYQCTRFPLVI